MDPFISSVTGTVCGGIFNFLIGRYWVFQSKNAKVHHQAFRYALVWTGNLVLNASGMFYLLKIAGVYYIIAKVIVSVIVGVGYNYVLQKKFVFK